MIKCQEKSFLLIILLSSFFSIVLPTTIENGLIGEPEIQCGAETVEMQFRTKKMFSGKVYVKGHYNNRECRVDYNARNSKEQPLGSIKLNHGACDMDRQRMISPQGMQFSTVLVISFHPMFITQIDQAFHIHCMYQETTKIVSSNLEVSVLTTNRLQHNFPMPSCTYTIRKDEIDGRILRYARVGEQIVHRWECHSDVYGILVHSCYVEDGQGEKQLIIDDRGCHTDRFLLGDPTYVEELNLAYREAQVFKFADRVSVRFQCEIRLCMKEHDGCYGITPPLCSSTVLRSSEKLVELPTNASTLNRRTPNFDRFRRRFVREVAEEQNQGNENHLGRFSPVDGDLFSQYLYVFESVEDPVVDRDRSMSLKHLLVRAKNQQYLRPQTVCFSSTTLSLLLFLLSISIIMVTFFIVLMATCRGRNTDQSFKNRMFPYMSQDVWQKPPTH